ncbi:MAG: hypothetical protein HYV42_01475 [Candidatus Magasanikbacteria bacterium]|nr:hypothetical protein [Candidatus Magasanikbacteria bacterium]
MDDLRIEMRAKNNILWHAIYDRFKTVAAFCRRYRFSESYVNDLIRLSRPPINRRGEWSPVARKLARVLKMLEEDLFPAHLYKHKRVKMLVVETSFAALNQREHQSLLAAHGELNPEISLLKKEAGELEEITEMVLATLTPRESRVIRSLFGIGVEQKTLPQIAAEFSEPYCAVTPKRIKQIAAKALRKLRHPSRSKRFWMFQNE